MIIRVTVIMRCPNWDTLGRGINVMVLGSPGAPKTFCSYLRERHPPASVENLVWQMFGRVTTEEISQLTGPRNNELCSNTSDF